MVHRNTRPQYFHSKNSFTKSRHCREKLAGHESSKRPTNHVMPAAVCHQPDQTVRAGFFLHVTSCLTRRERRKGQVLKLGHCHKRQQTSRNALDAAAAAAAAALFKQNRRTDRQRFKFRKHPPYLPGMLWIRQKRFKERMNIQTSQAQFATIIL